jgi:hypothetical protein
MQWPYDACSGADNRLQDYVAATVEIAGGYKPLLDCPRSTVIAAIAVSL